jgi:1-acyl-sn-glycerol-3-phosphate acyltransferase
MWLKYRIVRPPFAILAKTKKYKLRVQGQENIPKSGPFIVVSNHQSSADIIAVALALKPVLKHVQMWPWAKMEIGEGKEGVLGKWLYSFFGVIPIDREGKNIEEAIKKSHEHLQGGKIICIFPEGTRHTHKELGQFEYGIANLARTMPVPLLPVAVYRRQEQDGGIQVNIGKPFYLPPKKRYETLERIGVIITENFEETFDRHIDNLKEWAKNLTKDKRGAKLLRQVTRVVGNFLSSHDVDFKKICRMGETEDLDYIRDRVLELLPEGWKKVDKRRNS